MKKIASFTGNPNPDQRGMAAIIVTMVTMVVISLIVLGFATISRREQGQTLDQQLSTQAFYAAESGVEDAQHVIEAAMKAGKAIPGKTDCDTNTDGAGYTPNYPVGAGTVLDSGHNVSYSCLLVDPSPTSLKFDGVGTDNVVIPVAADDVIDKFVITWKPTNAPSGNPSSCPGSTTNVFSLQSKWTCGYGMMRMDLVPTEGALSRAGLGSSTLTSFFVPTRNAASGNLSYSGNTNKPNVTATNCTLGSYSQCTATITGLPAVKSFSLRLNSMYQPSNVTVVAYHGSTQLGISGAQATVDVTGKANDVLRRIQVRVPVGVQSTTASFALQTNGSLCKRFRATPNYLSIPSDIVNPDTSNDMCKAQSYGTPSSGG
jgi:Tfp pilus assembly protein PilV